MKTKCLFTYDYGSEKMGSLRELGYDLLLTKDKGVYYNDSMEDVEVLVCYNPFITLDITRMRNLKWIQLASIGVDQLPMEHVLKEKIIITNNKGGYSIPMGEWIVLKILELYKKSFDMYKNQIKHRWKIDTSISEVYGKNICFLGTGSIAVEGAKRLQGFGVKVLGINTDGRSVPHFDSCFKLEEFDNILPACDVLVVTIPSTEKTAKLINADRIGSMKNSSYIINVARGNIIDEKALIDALVSRKIKGAALDVFEKEPLDENSPLWDLDNAIITSHSSWASGMRDERRFEIIYRNMKSFLQGEDLINVVDLGRGY